MANKKFQGSKKWKRDPLIGTLTTHKENPFTATATLKAARNYRQAKPIVDALMSTGLVRAMFSKSKARSWDNILYIPRFAKSYDWIEEFGWLTHSFRLDSANIIAFHSLSSEFWRFFLMAEYEESAQRLKEIEKQFGLSIWLAEKQFIQLQASYGFEAHKKTLSAIQRQIEFSFTAFILTMLSNRTEPHVTHDAFRLSVHKTFQSLQKDGFNDLSSLVELHLYPWNYQWAASGFEMLSWCDGRPIADRYDTAIKIVAALASQKMSSDQRERLTDILNDLASSIPDRQLRYLFLLLGLTDEIEPDTATEEYFTALDGLVEGRYMETAYTGEALIISDPTCFEYYWLTARAMACSRDHFKTKLKEGSTARQILDYLFQVAENRVNVNIPLEALQNIALKIGDTYLGICLYQFVQREAFEKPDANAYHQAFVQSSIDSIELLSLIKDRNVSIGLSATGFSLQQHTCINLFLQEPDGAAMNETLLTKMTPTFAAITRAKRAARQQHYKEVLSELEIFKGRVSDNLNELRFHMGDVATLEFEAFTQLDDSEAAAEAILRHYITNPNTLRHVPFEELIKGTVSGKWETLRRRLYWPILVYLNNGDAQDIYEAVDDLLIENGLTSPLQIADGGITYSKDELRIMLRDVLVPSVISRGALWYRTAEDRRALRTTLLQMLFALSIEDQAMVIEEISTIEQAKLLEDAYRNVEGPKFYFDYVDVNKSLSILLQGVFERYLEHREYEDKGGRLATDSDLLELAKAGINSKPSNEKKTDTSDLLLRHISIMTFMQYLWAPQKGIHAALSTRVRHGALENQLKRVFDAYSLLASRGVDGNYKCAESLSSRFSSLDRATRDAIERAFIEFTTTISTIYDRLMTVHLKIRIPDVVIAVVEEQGLPSRELSGSEGVLDYTELFSDETLLKLKQSQPTSVAALIIDAQQIFVENTRRAFSSARAFFEQQVRESIQNAIDNLDMAVIDRLDDGHLRASVRGLILTAKDEFAQDLKIIQNWFGITERFDTGISSLKILVATAWRVVNFASNNKLGVLMMPRFDNEELTPQASVMMYEVLSVLLRNVVQHSNVVDEQNIECEHIHNGERRTLILRNRVDTNERCMQCVTQAQKSLDKPYNERILDQSPGGTGLGRIFTLMRNNNAAPVFCRSGVWKVQFASKPESRIDMNILVIEDNDIKFNIIATLLREELNIDLPSRAASYQAAISTLVSQSFDWVILDMTLPVSDLELSPVGMEFLAFGGQYVLRECHRRRVQTNIVVVTQYGTFVRDEKEVTFAQLSAELMPKYKGILRGCIRLDRDSESWKFEIIKLLKNENTYNR